MEVPFTCILSISQQGATALVAQRSKIHKKPDRNPSALFVYGLSKHLPDDFINSVTSLKSCWIQDDAHLCSIWQFLTHFHSSHEKLWFRKAKMVRPEMLKSRLEKDSPCFILMFITTLFQKRMLFIISEQFQIIKTIWW